MCPKRGSERTIGWSEANAEKNGKRTCAETGEEAQKYKKGKTTKLPKHQTGKPKRREDGRREERGWEGERCTKWMERTR